MRTIRCHGLALVSTAAALAASALLAAPPATATPTDPALLSNLTAAGSLGAWSLGGSTYWIGNLVTSSTGGKVSAVTFNMAANPSNSSVGTAVRLFADSGGVVNFQAPYGVLAYESTVGNSWTYTGLVTVPAGPFWIGMSYTGSDGQSRDIAKGDSDANASGPWTFAACPNPTAGTTCLADGNYSVDPAANAYDDTLWPEIAIYGVASGGSGSPTNRVTRIEYVQQVPMPESGGCATVDDAEFAWNTGLTGGWKPSWAQWASSGRGGPICTRMLVNTGQTWGVE